MARRYEKIVVRKTNGLTIIFENPTTIYVQHKYGVSCYDRWFVKQRGFYTKNWKPFSESLKQNRVLEMGYINRLAEQYEISVSGSRTLPDLTDKPIKTIPEWGRDRNVH